MTERRTNPMFEQPGGFGERRSSASQRPDAEIGGFPVFEAAHPGPDFGRFITAMRQLQDMAVSTNPDASTWSDAADRVQALVDELAPFQAGEGVGPAGRVPDLPGGGSLLMPPWIVERFEPDEVQLRVTFSRFHVGGNYAVHGGVLPLLFDSVFGMVIHAAGRPISRTAFLHVDYRKVTPIEVELTARGWIREAEGRKAFVNAELRDPEGNLLAEANGLMVRLLAGQP